MTPGSPPDWHHIDVAVADHVAIVTMDRPDRLNALTFDSYAELRDFFAHVPLRDDVEAIVLTGRGDGFCSGGDVDEIIGRLLEMDARSLLDFTRMTGAVVQNMRDCPIPVVAAVNGTAAGAGAVLALAADFRVMAESARLHFLFTRVGLSGGDMGSAYLLPRMVGLGRATEILMFGDPIDGERAVAIGLANRVEPAGSVMDVALEIAARIVAGPTFAYRSTKRLLSRELDMDLQGSLELEAMTQALLMTTDDHAEFHKAFHEGRAATWRGR